MRKVIFAALVLALAYACTDPVANAARLEYNPADPNLQQFLGPSHPCAPYALYATCYAHGGYRYYDEY